MFKINNNQIKIPKAIIFDTDNTLYPYNQSHKEAMAAVESKVCKTLNISKENFDQSFITARNIVKKRLHGTASSHSRLLYFQAMLENLGLGSQVLLALDFEQTYWRSFLSHSFLFEGVIDLLETIRQKKIPCAIVTDLTAQIQFRKVVYFGLEHYFNFIVSSEEAGFDKPHEAPFLLALEKLSLSNNPDKNSVWMIGDNPVNDILGAKKTIEAFTIQKIHPGVEQSDSADIIFSSFLDLNQFLQKLK